MEYCSNDEVPVTRLSAMQMGDTSLESLVGQQWTASPDVCQGRAETNNSDAWVLTLQVSPQRIPKWHWCHEGGEVGEAWVLGTGPLESS